MAQEKVATSSEFLQTNPDKLKACYVGTFVGHNKEYGCGCVRRASPRTVPAAGFRACQWPYKLKLWRSKRQNEE